MKKFVKTAASLVLAVSLSLMPAAAFAQTDSISGAASEAENEAAELSAETNKASDRATFSAEAKAAAGCLMKNVQENIIRPETDSGSEREFPEKFDLRDRGVVTPVKLQNPWGTCWGFAAIAAAETSILSKMGKTYDETGLDLSEHQLTYFARTFMNDGSSQDGEGIHMYEGRDELDTGGVMFTATSLFSSGIGAADEELMPYRGRNSRTSGILGMNLSYSGDDDWSLPDEYKFVQSYELENSDILPSPAVYSDSRYGVAVTYLGGDETQGQYLGYSQSATDNMKQALIEGKAISVAYAADTYSPDQLGADTEPIYLNVSDNKWTHYTYDGGSINHAVTIVGWDDTIPRTDFLDHSNDPYGDGRPHYPEGDGAWIVKNSWGSTEYPFPNHNEWGIVEDGESTGYFYLSYYDRSISLPEVFDFRVKDDSDDYMIDQYDYMQADAVSGWLDDRKMSMANVFTAEEDGLLRAVSCETSTENVTVRYSIYKLAHDAAAPDDGELAAELTADYRYAGYHRSDLDECIDIRKGQKYSIVVEQQSEYDGKIWYGVSTDINNNKISVDRYNKQVMWKHRGESPNSYIDELAGYYAVGIVNPGESFIYTDRLGKWEDFSYVIPELQKYEKYNGVDFDNFAIKAYLDYSDNASYAEAATDELPDLGYAAPAGSFDFKLIFIELCAVIAAIAAVILLIRYIIRNAKRKKYIAAVTGCLAKANKEIARLGGTEIEMPEEKKHSALL